MSNQLRVWWIPQIPGKPFHVPVASIAEAEKILTVLADYDLFQYENRVKGDYCNVGGLEELVDGDWSEWETEDGESIEEVMRAGVKT